MKLGLLTIHDTLNYGSLLQAFGLYKAVESLGLDITLIDYKCKAVADRERTFAWKECRRPTDYARHFLFHKKLEEQRDNIWRFIKDNMKISDRYYKDSVCRSNDIFDAFLVGSDIVWGMNITGRDFTYMLDFVQNTKRKIAFSSSVGSKWGASDEVAVRKFLSRFDCISVREQLAAEWIEPLLGREISVTCDPTMLWNKAFWDKFVSSSNVPKDDYVLVYMRTKDEKNIFDAKEYGRKHGLPVYYINFDVPKFGVKNIRPVSVEDWISLFANARTVFSASYHGLLFSMYFHKNVFFYNRGNKSRMLSLSKELHIEDREGIRENVLADNPIDYAQVDKVLNGKCKESWDTLRKFLEVCGLL